MFELIKLLTVSPIARFDTRTEIAFNPFSVKQAVKLKIN